MQKSSNDSQVLEAVEKSIVQTPKLWRQLRIPYYGRVHAPEKISDLRSVSINKAFWLRCLLFAQIEERFNSQIVEKPSSQADKTNVLKQMEIYNMDVDIIPIPIDRLYDVDQIVPGTLKEIACAHCGGYGYLEQKCSNCRGTGVVLGYDGVTLTRCLTCSGNGVKRVECSSCYHGYLITYKRRIKCVYPSHFVLFESQYRIKGDMVPFFDPTSHYCLIWESELDTNLSGAFPLPNFGVDKDTQNILARAFDSALHELRYKVKAIFENLESSRAQALKDLSAEERVIKVKLDVERVVVNALELRVEICPVYQVKYRRNARIAHLFGDLFKKRGREEQILPLSGEINVIGYGLEIMPPTEYEHWKRPGQDQ